MYNEDSYGRGPNPESWPVDLRRRGRALIVQRRRLRPPVLLASLGSSGLARLHGPRAGY